MDVTPLDESTVYATAKKCYACGNTRRKLDKDHDHFTGAFRGLACHKCNIKMQVPRWIPCFFHNGSGFDFHFIAQAIARLSKLDADKEFGTSNEESESEEDSYAAGEGDWGGIRGRNNLGRS